MEKHQSESGQTPSFANKQCHHSSISLTLIPPECCFSSPLTVSLTVVLDGTGPIDIKNRSRKRKDSPKLKIKKMYDKHDGD